MIWNHAVPHTSEIPYVFGRLMNVTPRASALSTIMQDYWISFVNSLDPNDNRGNKRRAASLPASCIQYLTIYLNQVPIGRSTRQKTR